MRLRLGFALRRIGRLKRALTPTRYHRRQSHLRFVRSNGIMSLHPRIRRIDDPIARSVNGSKEHDVAAAGEAEARIES